MRGLSEFIFPRRLHRLAYFLRLMTGNIGMYILYSCNTSMDLSYWGFIIALFIYELFFIALPRARDIGMSGWWLLGFFIPVANVVLGLILLFRAPAILPRPAVEPVID